MVLQAVFAGGCLAALYALYAYGVRFERQVVARMGLRGDARLGAAWPLVDAARALLKPDPPSARGGGRLRLMAAWVTLLTSLFAWFVVAVAPGCAQWHWASLCRLPWALSDMLTPLALCALGALLCALQDAPRSAESETSGAGSRIALQGLRYKLAGMVALGGVYVLSGTTRLGALAAAPRPWIIYQPLGMALAAVSLLMAAPRLPAPPLPPEQAPWAAFHLQHGGRTWALLHLAEGVQVLSAAGLLAMVYLAGTAGPGADGLHWLALKMVLVALSLLWLKHRWLSERAWRMGEGLWRLMMLLGMANLVLTAALAAALRG